MAFNEFTTSENYNAGDYVWLDRTLFRFVQDHPAGKWTGQDVQKVSSKHLVNMLDEVQDGVDSLTESVNTLEEAIEGGGGSGGGQFIVTYTVDSEDDTVLTCDKTISEIAEAIESGKEVLGIVTGEFDTAVYRVINYSTSVPMVIFRYYGVDSTDNGLGTVDKVILHYSSNGADRIEYLEKTNKLIVGVQMINGVISISATYDVIDAARQAGVEVVLSNDEGLYRLICHAPYIFVKPAIYNSDMIMKAFIIFSDDNIAFRSWVLSSTPSTDSVDMGEADNYGGATW